MFDWILTTIHEVIIPLGGLGVFLATFTAQIIPPISTPLLLITFGILFLPDNLSWIFLDNLVFTIALPAALGITIGSLLIYALGYFSGKPFLEKWGKFIGLSWESVQKLEKIFEKSYWDEAILLGLRTFPLLPTVAVSFAAGLVRFKIRPYLVFTFLGTFAKVFILSTLGWQARSIYGQYAEVFVDIEKIGLIVLVAVLAFFLIWKKYFKVKNEKI